MSHSEHRDGACLTCSYTGSMSVHGTQRKHSRGAIVGIGLALALPLLLIELSLRMNGGAGISIVWFLLAAGVAYGLSLIEDVTVACPHCSASITL